jgi:hypothetical protein
MKDLNSIELVELNAGGFSYDVGCAWRYIGHFAIGYFSVGGGLYPGMGVIGGTALAEATKCK